VSLQWLFIGKVAKLTFPKKERQQADVAAVLCSDQAY